MEIQKVPVAPTYRLLMTHNELVAIAEGRGRAREEMIELLKNTLPKDYGID